MKLSIFAAVGAALVGLVSSSPVIAQNATNQFPTELAAQEYCKTSRVVWVNLNNNRYYSNRAAQYGRTKKGAYMCAKEARSAGFSRAQNERAQAF
jgi:hypothetical protein